MESAPPPPAPMAPAGEPSRVALNSPTINAAPPPHPDSTTSATPTKPPTSHSESANTSSSGTSSHPSATPIDNSMVEMNNSNSVLHKIANLYAEQLMSDIVLVVGANRYPAHRVILCASSEVFQVMLMNPEWNECRESVIELKEEPCCSDVFPQFLKYLYVGQIRVSLQTVMPMLALADKYNIRDLVQLCVDYMLRHVSKAATQGFLVSWLHYTISFSPYHQEVTDALQRFLKWNMDIVAEAPDFVDLDVDILIRLIQQNDLVLHNEFALFGYVERWLLHWIGQLDRTAAVAPGEASAQRTLAKQQTIESVVVHVRFAMMTPSELAELLLRPIVKQHTEFFVERISIGMSYHSDQEDRIDEVRRTHVGGTLQFTPRLYTSDTYSLMMVIPDYEKIEKFKTFGACFFSQSNLSEHQEDLNMQWNIDFYPRGIRYSRAQLINVFNMQSAVEIPETILNTVRLSVTCKRDLETEQRFKVGVLIHGVQNQIPHVRTVHVKTHYFSRVNRILNLDNLLPYDELELSSIRLSSHLIGSERNQIRLQVIIAPMGAHVSHETPLFEFK